MRNSIYLLLVFVFIYSCNETKKQENQQQSSTIEIEKSTEELTDDIQVKNIQIGSESSAAQDRFHTSYPKTTYDFINGHQEKFAQAYLDEFQNAIDKNSDQKRVAGLDFGQHFEIIESTTSIIGFLIERYTSYGNNYDTQYFTHIYDLEVQKRLEFSDLFSPQENFNQLAELVKAKTEDVMKAKINAMEGLTSRDRSALWKSSKEMIEAGTKPSDKNYHAFIWDDTGNLTIYFDKYQVASGNYGNIEVRLSPADYKHLVSKKYEHMLHLQSAIEDKIVSETPTSESTSKTFDIDCSQVPCVAITFDDGPATHTTLLLDILKEHDVKATFFVLGKSAKVQNNTLLRAFKEGHQIGNHSWDHKDLKKLSEDEIINQINKTNEVISTTIGEDIHVMRPPYGSFNDVVKNNVDMPIILWNLDPMDWKDRNASIVAERISAADKNGIILAHDIHKTTVEAMPEVISNLKDKGYHLVTVENLFAGKELSNGAVYNRRK
ncbi:peptidoglycan/xylan/chitin deacetylase (PgdA/CDA1 family) [Winogradskyella epiphytica]|uniref:Peptidoglycan/xylan/chitin deacetylase (PgdA/CDA1 family) n=1 Tax=Winogradskyella epiphytica TaxID=262005 RepID=A0A2V4WXV0_9FLAO|nr:polysaccharide deacetylase family protein [Winogradskyella epiphytica]PYE82076.1 peptidoglycan/xylan/chitin deacetylase (PgdA/CDA1 family) [Winogradskyella epiphytica]GGW60682.1 peptidoglycan-N-acetylmuramic acid deacetylase PdaC [Winogradskyella epiphytica]